MMAALKWISGGALRITVVALSELNRGAYRSKDAKLNSNGMAAGKHSGAIEYVSRILVNLHTAKDDVVRVEVEKPTGYADQPLGLRFDRLAATFTETDAPGEDDSERPGDEFMAVVRKVDGILRRMNVKNLNTLSRAARVRKGDAGLAVSHLSDLGMVFKNDLGFYQHNGSPLPADDDDA